MFKIYDLNFKEVSIPVERLGYGIKALDISIGPIIYDTVYSNGNRADTPIKRYPKDREVSINILTTAADTIDWRMKRDQVYTFFRRLGVFYVAESYQPFKLLKVMVDEDYEVDRPVTRWGLAEIPLKIIGTPFKQSLHTTGTIGSEGMLFNNKWGYSMGTWFAENYWQYEFTGIPVNENLLSAPYDYQKPKGEHAVTILSGGLPSGTYTISFEYTVNSGSNVVTNFLLYAGGILTRIELDNYIDSDSERVKKVFSIPENLSGNDIVLYGGTNGAESIDNDVSFTNIKIEEGNVATPFDIPSSGSSKKVTFYNAGTEEVKLIQQKESEITLTLYSIPPNNLIDIDDGSTTFKIWKEFKLGDVLKIKGDSITLNGVNVLGDTNFNFLTVKTGWNYWEVRGIKNFDFKIDFRFLYD